MKLTQIWSYSATCRTSVVLKYESLNFKRSSYHSCVMRNWALNSCKNILIFYHCLDQMVFAPEELSMLTTVWLCYPLKRPISSRDFMQPTSRVVRHNWTDIAGLGSLYWSALPQQYITAILGAMTRLLTIKASLTALNELMVRLVVTYTGMPVLAPGRIFLSYPRLSILCTINWALHARKSAYGSGCGNTINSTVLVDTDVGDLLKTCGQLMVI